MRVAILCSRPGWHTTGLVEAFSRRGHIAVVLPYERLVATIGGASGSTLTADGTPLLAGGPGGAHVDLVLPRIIPGGSLEQVIARVDTLHWLEASGVRVVNPPRAIERCVDKFYTTALLARAGLPVPETTVCQRVDDAIAAVRRLGQVVLKPIFGAMGQGLVRLDDPDVAWRVLRTLDLTRPVYYVQQAIAHDGWDVRVFVAGGRVVGAIRRHAAEGEWRTNVARGGRAEALDPPGLSDDWASLALAATAAVGADYAGVDLLPGRDGQTYVLEVNAIPAWRGLQEATGIDVAGQVADVALAGSAATDARASGARS